MTEWAINLLVLIAASAANAAFSDYRTTPVPILKQINRHNDDGSYSFGYEAADGTFKIETKYPTGEVYGKYGYVGEDGKLMEVEYGASRRGFEPSGSHINVPPPTLIDDVRRPAASEEDYDDGQYREDPSVYYKASTSPSQVLGYETPRPALERQVLRHQYSSPGTSYYSGRNAIPIGEPKRQYSHTLFPYDTNVFRGHPATHLNLDTGSYTVSYVG